MSTDNVVGDDFREQVDAVLLEFTPCPTVCAPCNARGECTEHNDESHPHTMAQEIVRLRALCAGLVQGLPYG